MAFKSGREAYKHLRSFRAFVHGFELALIAAGDTTNCEILMDRSDHNLDYLYWHYSRWFEREQKLCAKRAEWDKQADKKTQAGGETT